MMISKTNRNSHDGRYRVRPWQYGAAVVTILLLVPRAAWAHGAPDRGAEWLMADWMLLAFLVFFVAALAGFVIALRRGALSNVEAAKYYILQIHEPDYYTPDWAQEEPS
ncbi:MAG: hypothetical protein M3Z30_08250 [Gemmatimonadota bacterium]|nr:hypothetical protein [Gemmatimonadota bacterium]